MYNIVSICDFSKDDNCLQGYKLRFFSLKRGFERKLDFELTFGSSNVKSFALEYGSNPNERELLIKQMDPLRSLSITFPSK